ncbi:MAG: hypothetical protein ABFD82_19015 [Syntrophaceae bacterium]
MNQRKQRMQQLLYDLDQMNKLKSALPNTLQFDVNEGQGRSAPNKYHIQLAVRSIIGITKYGAPIFQDGLSIRIVLPLKYPGKAKPILTIYPAVFHPHVKIHQTFAGKRMGIWVEPEESYNGLGDLTLRVIRSLAYEPDYIFSTSSQIGNRNALDWFTFWNSIFTDLKTYVWFPANSLQFPDAMLFTAKRFVMEHNETVENKVVMDMGQTTVDSKKKSFQIIKFNPPYKPIIKQLPNFRALASSDFRGRCLTHRLLLRQKATKQIFAHIQWGLGTSENKVEQGGLLVGHALQDADGLTYGLVEEAIAGESAQGTSAYLRMNHGTWKNMIDRVDTILDNNPDDSLQIIGWYHTHPNHLDVFMSSTDRATQSRMFPNHWQFAVVLNPHKKIWRVFHGSDVEECQGYFVDSKD